MDPMGIGSDRIYMAKEIIRRTSRSIFRQLGRFLSNPHDARPQHGGNDSVVVFSFFFF